MLKIDGRKVILKAIYGSHNYGLVTPTSDKDFKIFVLPTLDDLLTNKMVSKTFKDENGNDNEVKDIRLLLSLIEKCNPSYMEIPFSTQLEGEETLVKFLQKNRHLLFRENVKGFVNATTGMCYEKIKAIEKDLPNEPTNEGYKRKIKFGYDTKQLVHTIRLSNIMQHLYDGDELSYRVEPNLAEMLKRLKDYGDFVIFDENVSKEEALIWMKDLVSDMKLMHQQIIDKHYIENGTKNKELKELIFGLIKDDLSKENDKKRK